MADKILAKGDKPRPIHPAGTFAARCSDVIDMGEDVVDYKKPGETPYLAQKAIILWSTGKVNPETGKPFDLRAEYTVSMGPKANLRKMLVGWRGQDYTPEQLQKGAPLDKLEGQWCLITVAHQVAKGSGNTFAKVLNVGPIPEEMPRPDLPPYTRDKWWAEQKVKYAERAEAFRSSHGIREESEEDFSDFPGALDGDPEEMPL